MLIESARILWRRRWWVVAALIVAVAAGQATYQAVKPMQESKAQVLLLGSLRQPGVKDLTNPFNNLGGSLGVVANVLAVQVTDEQSVTALIQRGATAKFSVAPNLAENAGPSLLIAADDVSADLAHKTMIAVVDQIQTELAQLQTKQNVQADLFIKSIVLTQSAHPLPVRKAQVQKAILATLGAATILIVLILLIERRQLSRARKAALSSPRAIDSATDDPVALGDDASLPRQRRKEGRRRTAQPGRGRPAEQDAPSEEPHDEAERVTVGGQKHASDHTSAP
jgi:hypothetical protein